MMGNEKLKLKNKLVTDRNFSVAKLISPHFEGLRLRLLY